LISRLTLNSRSNVSYIRKTLSELDDYIASIDSNVTAFNEFGRLQMDALEVCNSNEHINPKLQQLNMI